MSGTELSRKPAAAVEGIQIDQAAVLRHLGLDANDPAAQALVLACQRYDLDPILRHALLIEEKKGDKRLYVTRDGLLHVAHRSDQLDGIEVLEQGETDTHHVARVAVHRKDMSKPFVYVGRYPKMRPSFEWYTKADGGRAKRKVGDEPHPYGPEMAVKCAEAMALRRAFDVSLSAVEEMWDRQDIAAQPAPQAIGKESPSVGQPAVTGPAASNGEPVRSDDQGSGESSLASPDSDPPLAGGRPCPHCGWECEPMNAGNANWPKWKCTNDSCRAHKNTKTDELQPWVSWHKNPWKPGGEYEQIKSQAESETSEPLAANTVTTPPSKSVEGGGDQAATSQEEPIDGSAAVQPDESPDGSADPSPQDGQHALELIADALDAEIIKVGDVIRAASSIVMSLPVESAVKVPTKRDEFEYMPPVVSVGVAEKLKLAERVPA